MRKNEAPKVHQNVSASRIKKINNCTQNINKMQKNNNNNDDDLFTTGVIR